MAQHPALYSVVVLILGAIGIQLWNRFRNRTISLTWTATHQQHAVSSSFAGVGTISVQVNGTEARCLYLTTVELRNPTVRDIADIEVKFELPVDSTIVGAEGQIEGQVGMLSVGDDFSVDATRAREIWTEDTPESRSLRANVSRWRSFALPAFNRQSIATFRFLWENGPAIHPIVKVATVHLGVKLDFQKVPQVQILGIDNRYAALFGILLAVVLGLVLFSEPREWLILFFGIVSAAIGALVIRAWQLVMRLAS